ncbi:class I SAM-dependent methyltransferase [Candidatus Woesearchaeota archaeon]|nr:class I SAM-dependent methyltransferase [Candidatus Woesearchaeota archaeon]
MMISKIYKELCTNKAKKIYEECGKYIIGGVLDVGSGRGYIAKEISKYGKNVQCLDVKDHNLTDLPLKIYDGKRIPFKAGSFDTVLVCYVLHHADDPTGLLKECIRVSKKRGIIFEDNADSLLTKPLDILFNRLHGVDTPLNFRSISQWIKEFKKLNLKIIKIKRGVEKQWFYPGVEHIMFVVDKV